MTKRVLIFYKFKKKLHKFNIKCLFSFRASFHLLKFILLIINIKIYFILLIIKIIGYNMALTSHTKEHVFSSPCKSKLDFILFKSLNLSLKYISINNSNFVKV